MGIKSTSVDAIVCDPPYGLEFMGKEWDKLEKIPKGYIECKSPNSIIKKKMPRFHQTVEHNSSMQLWHTQWLTEAYRVLKPGGSMLVMGGTRTSHRLACAIEDAGFIIKDTLMWLYGSGFPKAQDLGEMIKKRGGDGEYWDGFKVGGIKPAYEPIIWAVKPPEGSYVDNVLKWGVGAVNVDECRIGTEQTKTTIKDFSQAHGNQWGKAGITYPTQGYKDNPKGRFPANVILDEKAGEMLDEQSGKLSQVGGAKKTTHKDGMFGIGQPGQVYFDGNAGASRFFYCAKASRGERNAGLEGMEEKKKHTSSGDDHVMNEICPYHHITLCKCGWRSKAVSNFHPTVKPIKLFEWLIKLVTREGQIVLDPFIGSGTTAIAAYNTGRKCVGIEKEGEYLEIAKRRIEYWEGLPRQLDL